MEDAHGRVGQELQELGRGQELFWQRFTRAQRVARVRHAQFEILDGHVGGIDPAAPLGLVKMQPHLVPEIDIRLVVGDDGEVPQVRVRVDFACMVDFAQLRQRVQPLQRGVQVAHLGRPGRQQPDIFVLGKQVLAPTQHPGQHKRAGPADARFGRRVVQGGSVQGGLVGPEICIDALQPIVPVIAMFITGQIHGMHLEGLAGLLLAAKLNLYGAEL